MDPHTFSKQDPDPHSPKKLDPDLHKVIADPKHWKKYRNKIVGTLKLVIVKCVCLILVLLGPWLWLYLSIKYRYRYKCLSYATVQYLDIFCHEGFGAGFLLDPYSIGFWSRVQIA
jgi:hypothetical protein